MEKAKQISWQARFDLMCDDLISGIPHLAVVHLGMNPSSVWRWRYYGIPKKHWEKLEKVTNLTVSELSQYERRAWK